MDVVTTIVTMTVIAVITTVIHHPWSTLFPSRVRLRWCSWLARLADFPPLVAVRWHRRPRPTG
jgi:hypothetical protein